MTDEAKLAETVRELRINVLICVPASMVFCFLFVWSMYSVASGVLSACVAAVLGIVIHLAMAALRAGPYRRFADREGGSG